MRYVEYIETDGRCYFDTGIIPNINTKVEIQVDAMDAQDQIGSWRGYIGAQNHDDDESTFQIRVYNDSDAFDARIGNANPYYQTISTGQTYTLTLDYNNFVVSGSSDMTVDVMEPTTMDTNNQSLYIAAIHCPDFSEDDYRGVKTRVRYVKIWSNNTLVAELKPAEDNGSIGFYDSVGDSFKSNLGNGTPIAGPYIQEVIHVDAENANLTASGGSVSGSVEVFIDLGSNGYYWVIELTNNQTASASMTIGGQSGLTFYSGDTSGVTNFEIVVPAWDEQGVRPATVCDIYAINRSTGNITSLGNTPKQIIVLQNRAGKPLYLGDSAITTMYIGNSGITAAYLGNVLVFGIGGDAPTPPAPVIQYLSGIGHSVGSFIQTCAFEGDNDFSPESDKYEVTYYGRGNFCDRLLGTYPGIDGVTDSSDFRLFSWQGTTLDIGGDRYSDYYSDLVASGLHTAVVSGGVVTLDGNQICDKSDSEYWGNVSKVVPFYFDLSSVWFVEAKIYINYNGQAALEHDWKAAMSGSVIGVYDEVEHIFIPAPSGVIEMPQVVNRTLAITNFDTSYVGQQKTLSIMSGGTEVYQIVNEFEAGDPSGYESFNYGGTATGFTASYSNGTATITGPLASSVNISASESDSNNPCYMCSSSATITFTGNSETWSFATDCHTDQACECSMQGGTWDGEQCIMPEPEPEPEPEPDDPCMNDPCMCDPNPDACYCSMNGGTWDDVNQECIYP